MLLLASKVFNFCYGPSNSFLRQVAFKLNMGIALRKKVKNLKIKKKKEVSMLSADPRRILAVFLWMISYPSSELINVRARKHLCIPGTSTVPFRKKCFVLASTFHFNWKHLVNNLIHGQDGSQGTQEAVFFS